MSRYGQGRPLVRRNTAVQPGSSVENSMWQCSSFPPGGGPDGEKRVDEASLKWLVSDGAISHNPVLALNYVWCNFCLFWLNTRGKAGFQVTTVGKAFSVPVSIFLCSRASPAALGRPCTALFLTAVTPAVSVLTWPLVVPPESHWQHRGACQYCWQSTWLTFMNWMWPMGCWTKGYAVDIICNQKTPRKIVLALTQTKGAQQRCIWSLSRMGTPKALHDRRDSFSCTVRFIILRHFLYLCWNVRPAANVPRVQHEPMLLCTGCTTLAHLGLLAAGISVS